MAAIVKSYCIAILFLGLVTNGKELILWFCDCSFNDIGVGQVRSERLIQGKPEWNVTVTNNCSCFQVLITLACKGFQSVEYVEPSILFKQGDICMLNKGHRLDGHASIAFSYAWDPPFLLMPVNSTVICTVSGE
ncbi:hypothetical protein L1049_021641 [Liquidambar formosana]|uniref:Uncharacterized protein n=1 Tax=Liquidambar formosana TaxID=63359 RepID=A0AAP0N429_LIQFO